MRVATLSSHSISLHYSRDISVYITNQWKKPQTIYLATNHKMLSTGKQNFKAWIFCGSVFRHCTIFHKVSRSVKHWTPLIRTLTSTETATKMFDDQTASQISCSASDGQRRIVQMAADVTKLWKKHSGPMCSLFNSKEVLKLQIQFNWWRFCECETK